jgi:hypothetical protein
MITALILLTALVFAGMVYSWCVAAGRADSWRAEREHQERLRKYMEFHKGDVE